VAAGAGHRGTWGVGTEGTCRRGAGTCRREEGIREGRENPRILSVEADTPECLLPAEAGRHNGREDIQEEAALDGREEEADLRSSGRFLLTAAVAAVAGPLQYSVSRSLLLLLE